jgi:hypothetical protein
MSQFLSNSDSIKFDSNLFQNFDVVINKQPDLPITKQPDLPITKQPELPITKHTEDSNKSSNRMSMHISSNKQ